MTRFQCNFCKYNLTVSEALEPWANQVILSHAKRYHSAELEKPAPKEEPKND